MKSKKPKTLNAAAKSPTKAQRGTKTAQLIGLLERPDGASIQEMMKLSGWQSHSVRGFIAGTLKKQAKAVTSSVDENGARRYRMVVSATGAS